MISVSVDQNKKDAGVFAKEVKATFPVLWDPQGTLASKLGATGVPFNIVIGRSGKVVTSLLSEDVHSLEKAIKRALAQR